MPAHGSCFAALIWPQRRASERTCKKLHCIRVSMCRGRLLLLPGAVPAQVFAAGEWDMQTLRVRIKSSLVRVPLQSPSLMIPHSAHNA